MVAGVIACTWFAKVLQRYQRSSWRGIAGTNVEFGGMRIFVCLCATIPAVPFQHRIREQAARKVVKRRSLPAVVPKIMLVYIGSVRASLKDTILCSPLTSLPMSQEYILSFMNLIKHIRAISRDFDALILTHVVYFIAHLFISYTHFCSIDGSPSTCSSPYFTRTTF